MELSGLPLHPLVVHAVVALVPLAVLCAVVLAVLPKWRWLTRWAALLTSLGALVAVFVARQSGEELRESDRYAGLQGDAATLLHTHEERSEVLLWVFIAFTVLVLLAFLLLPAPTGLTSGRLDHAGSAQPWLARTLAAALVVVGVVALVWVVLTGDAGARSVWEL